MLTGKAKKDFERWRFMQSHTYIYDLPIIFKFALLKAFFKDKNLLISIIPHGDGNNWFFGISDFINEPKQNFYDRLSYKIYKENKKLKVKDYYECTELAIKRANEIYNTKST